MPYSLPTRTACSRLEIQLVTGPVGNSSFLAGELIARKYPSSLAGWAGPGQACDTEPTE